MSGQDTVPLKKEASSTHTNTASQNPLQHYLKEIRKYPILTREQEIENFKHYINHRDAATREFLITCNLRLVVAIAFKLQNSAPNIPCLELIQEGNRGLIMSVPKYSLEKQAKFSTYAALWIKAYMLKYIRENYQLTKFATTEKRKKLVSRLNKTTDKFKAKGVDPTPELLAQEFGFKIKDILEAQEYLSSRQLSLDEPLGEEGNATRGDYLRSNTDLEEAVVNKNLKEKLSRLIDRFRQNLSQKEKTVLDHRIYCYDPETLEDVGNRLNITRERARQIENKVRQKLKKFIRKEEITAQKTN